MMTSLCNERIEDKMSKFYDRLALGMYLYSSSWRNMFILLLSIFSQTSEMLFLRKKVDIIS